MQLSEVQFTDAESAIIVLLAGIFLVLIFFILRQNSFMDRHFNKLDYKLNELARTAHAQQDNFQRTRSALFEAQSNMQSKMEQRFGEVQQALEKRLGEMSQSSVERLAKSSEEMQKSLQLQLHSLQKIKSDFEQRFGDMQQSIEKRLGRMSKDSIESFAKSNNELHELLQKRLADISGQVEQRLNKGFEKTTKTFADVMERLVLIDAAQKRIDELSSNVVSLQEVLTDKRSRGAFGEVQMAGLIRNVMPESSYALQHTLSNGTRVDCIMFLPDPTGHIAIDSKFPLDSYQKMMDDEASEAQRLSAEKQFRLDIRKHIKDVSEKYIIKDETADGAIMFIPAEAVFAEIHAHQPSLVEEAQRARVWMVSPTTLMAVLTTARAVLKDSATRKQVHIIQEHLVNLAKDFNRFRARMDNLSKHIQQANNDVKEAHISATKISSRFEKIEKVEIREEDVELLETDQSS
ncbi:MAG: DNA recombination protein RmuC [Gammaproteobacteria bacterium]|nr:DNA recombination protein RmuC [Gammaproteobacteria bacterium]